VIEQTSAAWLARYLEAIHQELGGSEGRTPLADFIHAADYKPTGDAGGMQFVVTVKQGIHRGHRRTIRRNWRKESDPTIVSAEVLRAYRELLAEI
jgi:hypothetical protein